MDLNEHVQAARHVKEAAVKHGAAVLPPVCQLYKDGKIQLLMTSPDAESEHVMSLLMAMTILKSDEMVLGVEAFARPEDNNPGTPIDEDPFATNAIVLIRAVRDNPQGFEWAVLPYGIGDHSDVVWQEHASMVAPIVGMLQSALQEIKVMPEVSTPQQFVHWAVLQGFGIGVFDEDIFK